MLWFMDYESYKQWENRFQAREVDGIDLILGGHDHHYTHSVESDVTILKSGSEFREFSTIDVKYYGRHSVSVFRCHLCRSFKNCYQQRGGVTDITSEHHIYRYF